MTCITCGRGEMVEERHARVVERDGRLAVVRYVRCSSVASAARSTSTSTWPNSSMSSSGAYSTAL
jgi:hypothetical protein